VTNDVAVHGYCSPKFETVKNAFANNFIEFGELGASCCIYIDGEVVVDIWGGWADNAQTTPWRENTLSGFYSVGKSFVALCALRAAEQHGFALDTPIIEVWPEYGANGKHHTTLRHLLSHRAGLPAIRRPLTNDALTDWSLITHELASQEPYWQPGTAHGYHTNTFGFLAGEFVRRITGVPVDQYFQQQIAVPLMADAHFGLSDHDLDRAAQLHWPAQEQLAESAASQASARAPDTSTNPDQANDQTPEQIAHLQMMATAYSNPKGISSLGIYNTDMWRQTVVPSTNGFGTAKGIARIYNSLANDGRANGYQVLSAQALKEATRTQCEGPDKMLGRELRWGLGFQLTHENRPMGPNPNSFGHFGNGGSLGFADPDAKLAFGYTLNRIVRDWGSPQNKALMKAAYSCL